jgi:cytochrome c oxidase cbb3-type subunit 4
MNAMDYSTFSSLMTVVMLVVFLGIVAWACSSRRSAAFAEAARVPFEEDAETCQPQPQRHG